MIQLSQTLNIVYIYTSTFNFNGVELPVKIKSDLSDKVYSITYTLTSSETYQILTISNLNLKNGGGYSLLIYDALESNILYKEKINYKK